MARPVRRSLVVWLVLVVVGVGCGDWSGSIRRVDGVDTGTAYDVTVGGGYAYVASNEGLVIIDVERLDDLARAAVVALDGAIFGVHLDGSLAYVGGGGRALTLVDVADRVRPVVLGVVEGGVIEGICTEGTVVYAGGLSGELSVFDVADPGAPRRVGGLVGSDMIRDLWCRDDVVYAAVPDQGLQVIDVSEPGSRVLVTIVAGTEGALDIDVAGDLMFVGCHGNGVRIIDISDTRSPTRA